MSASTKVSVWKVCSNILPTYVNLLKKGLALDTSCLFCSSSTKSVPHVLIDCSFARAMLFSSTLKLRLSTSSSTSLREWLGHMVADWSQAKFDLLMMFFGGIWRASSSLLWEGK